MIKFFKAKSKFLLYLSTVSPLSSLLPSMLVAAATVDHDVREHLKLMGQSSPPTPAGLLAAAILQVAAAVDKPLTKCLTQEL